MKKYIIGGLVGFVLATAASANAEGVTKLIDQVVQGVFPVTVEGNAIGEAVVIDNKTYLPVREFGEAVGYTVTFTEDREVVLTKNVDSTIPNEPVVSKPPVNTVNPRISEINKELEEWNGRLVIVNDEIKNIQTTISSLEEKKKNTTDDRELKEIQGSLDTSNLVLAGIIKDKKQMVESEITKLQAELQSLQNK